MLPVIYAMQKGVMIPTIDPTNNLEKLVEYLEAFDLALEKTINSGEPTEEYEFYSEQLKIFVELYPHFEYERRLEKKWCDIISGFYSAAYLKSRIKKKYSNKNDYDY